MYVRLNRKGIDRNKKIATAYSEYGVGRDDGKSRGEHCSVLYLKDRFKLDKKDCGTFWFSDTPEKIASKSWGNEIPRICTWVRLIEKKTNKKLGIMVFSGLVPETLELLCSVKKVRPNRIHSH